MDLKKTAEFLNTGNNKFILIIVLVGVCFMLFSLGGDNDTKKDISQNQSVNVNDEEKLEKILSEISGVGEVSVMVTYFSSSKADVAYETKESHSQREENDVKNNEISSDKQAVMSSGEPFVMRSIYPDVKGVVVVAQGAGVATVKDRITRAVTTAMGIAAHRVCVVEKNR